MGFEKTRAMYAHHLTQTHSWMIMNKLTSHNRQNKKERHRMQREQAKKTARKKRQVREASEKGQDILYHIAQTINQFFPDLWDRIDALVDPRKKSLNIR